MKNNKSEDRRLYILFSGRVQGVGFRFTTERIAWKYHLTGFVKNLFDGRVEVVAEGNEKQLNSFLNELRDYFGRYIFNEEKQWLEPTGEFDSFGIRF